MPLNTSLSQLNPNHTLKTPILILSTHQVCSLSVTFNRCEITYLNSVSISYFHKYVNVSVLISGAEHI